MNEAAAPRSSLRLRLGLALAGLAVLGASAFGIYQTAGERAISPVSGPPGQIAPGWASAPQPLPEIRFQGEDGRPLGLADFRGKVVLLNVWATWCVPCREEMPALDRLQQSLGGKDFEVVALSIDGGGLPAVRRFFDEVGIRSLKVYLDSSMQASGKLRIVGVPTTLLIDREGRERWRKTGPAQWDAPAIVEPLRSRLREGAS